MKLMCDFKRNAALHYVMQKYSNLSVSAVTS